MADDTGDFNPIGSMLDAFGGQDFLSSVAGAWMGSNAASSSKRWANHWNRVQYEWQRELAESGVQMRVNDMKAAGINPMSSFMGGSGSMGSAGQGGGFSTQAVPNRAESMTKMMDSASTALGMKRVVAEVDNLKKMGQQIDEQTKKTIVDAHQSHSADFLNRELALKAKADATYSHSAAANAQMDTLLKSYDLPLKKLDAEMYESGYGEILRRIQKLKETVGGFGGSSAPKYSPLGSHGAFNPRTGEIIGGR